MRFEKNDKRERGGTPAIVSRSGPLPAVMHLCSYACSHTPQSTCGFVRGTEDAAQKEPVQSRDENHG